MLRATRPTVARFGAIAAARPAAARLARSTLPSAYSLRANLPCARAQAPQLRFYSPTSKLRHVDEPAKIVDYKDMKKLSENPRDDTVLVDVREPAEYEQGHIPTAVNVPFKSMPGAFGLDAAEFHDTLGFEKPSTDKTLVFYCLGGVRSSAAEQLASTYGYQHRENYLGSYEDWQKHEAPASA